MALGALPTLQEIKTELGSPDNDLVSFIADAGKSGVWTSQLDFAGYSSKYAVTYDFVGFSTVVTNTTRIKDSYQRVDIIPTAAGRSVCNETINVTYSLQSNEDVFGAVTLSYGFSTVEATAPSSWTVFASGTGAFIDSGSAGFAVGPTQYLWLRIYVERKSLTTEFSVGSISLVDGTASVCSSSVTASGSPLTWSLVVGTPV